VRVFPSLHACTWVLTDSTSSDEEHGHTGLTQDERAAVPGGLVERIRSVALGGTDEGRAIMEHIQSSAGSLSDGGTLVYLIETPEGSVFYQDTSGCWTGVLAGIRADSAILAASGRANVDGEPIQGSMVQFLAMEAKLLGARKVVLGHHDNWMPPVTRGGFEMASVRAQLAIDAPASTLLEASYLEPIVLSG